MRISSSSSVSLSVSVTSSLWLFLFVSSCFLVNLVDADLYHCSDATLIDKKTSLECDKNTNEWKLDALNEKKPPQICGDDYINNQPTSMPGPVGDDFGDDIEPCIWWSIFFGSLNTPTPTVTPTFAPTTLEPTHPITRKCI